MCHQDPSSAGPGRAHLPPALPGPLTLTSLSPPGVKVGQRACKWQAAHASRQKWCGGDLFHNAVAALEGPGPTIPEKELWGGAWGTRPCSASLRCHWEDAAAPQRSARPQPHPALVLQTVSQSLPPGGDWRAAITV